MNELSNILAGYGVISCLVIGGVYIWSLPEMEKSVVTKTFCSLLMISLAAILVFHVLYFMHGFEPLEHQLYVSIVSLVPLSYFFFSRDLLGLSEGLRAHDIIHFLLIPLVFFIPLKLGVLASFIAGSVYTFYIFVKTLRLRIDIPRYRFEKFFFAMFFFINIMVLGLGIAVQIFEPGFYYHAYTACISLAMITVSTALLVFPELLSDVLLASQHAYAKTKLENINVDLKCEELEKLMVSERCFEDEYLSLKTVSERLELSTQQLSELVNTRFAMSFPKYVTKHRIEAAKDLLVTEPNTSVLAISMATGFKSQSTFYTAFKDHTNLAPAAYRKEYIRPSDS